MKGRRCPFGNGKNNSENRTQLDDAIGQSGTVKNIVCTSRVEIRDMDSLTEEDDVRSVLAAI